jgi:rhodanese-related sulfurtransferase
MSKSKALSLTALAAAILGWFLLDGSASSHTRIDGTRARTLVAEGAKLVDVRTPAEFSDKHISGAVNIPVQNLSSRLKELEPKTQALVLYCRSGHRSGIAFDQLKNSGFTNVYDLGPMTAW